jgi:predicted transcriptional regulator
MEERNVAPNGVERHRGKLKRKKGERKQRKRIEDAVQYALAQAVRLKILILLNETSYTTSEVANLVGIEVSKASNHLIRMWEDGAIEVAKVERRRGTLVNWYRAVQIPEITPEEAEAMTVMELQMIAGVIVQSSSAEVMAALHKGTLASAKTILSWDWHNVDKQGWEEIDVEVHQSIARIKEIACESMNRVAVSKDETKTIVVNYQAFERARRAERPRSESCDPPQ